MKNIIQGFKNLLYWLPVIWKDRNWDQWYIYEILKHKLQYQYDYLYTTKSRFDEDHNRALEYLRTCLQLIKRCQDEFYDLELILDEQYGINFTANPDKMYTGENPGYIAKHKSAYRRIQKRHAESYLGPFELSMLTSMNRADKANELLFRILSEKIGYFWD